MRKKKGPAIAEETIHRVNFDFEGPILTGPLHDDVIPPEGEKAYGVIYARYSSHSQREVSIEQQIQSARSLPRKIKSRSSKSIQILPRPAQAINGSVSRT